MKKITIIGAGMMGSALSFPAIDNGHKVNLVGIHLDEEIISRIRKDNFHPSLKRNLDDRVETFYIEEVEQAIKGSDLIIGGVSSFGVGWFSENIIPKLDDTVPLIMVTKGLHLDEENVLSTFPKYFKENLAENSNLSINAIGGPCTSYELADRRNSNVAFCGEDRKILAFIKEILETSYYKISLSDDILGLETAVALKNAYALAVTLAVGMIEKEEGIGTKEAYNPQAALFGQSVYEMGKLLELLGGRPENIVFGTGDLYVTIFGGRTRLLGTLLGRGLSFDKAIGELSDVTLESVVITERIIRALSNMEDKGKIILDEYPLIKHIGEIILDGKEVDLPWSSFTRTYFRK